MSLYLGTSPVANTGYNKANTDLSNLASTGKNIANWSNNVTNCITEIPQDIKLELNNGTLTLKAGSKVYVPNGFEADGTTPKFDEVVISNDITATYADGKTYVAYVVDGSRIGENNIETTVSGNTDTLTSWHLWYDTTNNIIKRFNNNNQVVDNKCSLPICIYLTDRSTITSIDQVFNGFGYIGSTVFALPGVKGLIPNGSNADGTLKNIEWTANKVITQTLTFGAQSYYFGVFNNNQELAFYGKLVTNYDEKSNTIIDTYPDPDVVRIGWSFFGECTADSNNRIMSFTSKTAIHALDYNDSSTISGWAMPSSRYIDLTLGASGAEYTAPANGWFTASFNSASALDMWPAVSSVSPRFTVNYSSERRLCGSIPAKKGDTVRIYWASSRPEYLRFVYAEGEKNV
jgi:hypothetical protein